MFPKQIMAASGNGLNLPFFGKPEELAAFSPNVYQKDLPLVELEPTTQVSDSDDEGYWTVESLRAMLVAFSEFVPGFEFRPCRNGHAVPCPGYDEGWEDGARHSANQFPRISHEAIAFATLIYMDEFGSLLAVRAVESGVPLPAPEPDGSCLVLSLSHAQDRIAVRSRTEATPKCQLPVGQRGPQLTENKMAEASGGRTHR